jgi:putative MFS transporter
VTVPTTGPRRRFDRRERRLLALLSVATFFEGYDLIAITQVLPNLRRDLGLTPSEAGVLVAGVNAGAIAAWFLVNRADRFGRRRLLQLTILGYALATGASGLAPDAWTFGALQFVARTFLLGEWAVAMLYAAEEFPAERRGLVIGLIQAFSSLGSVVCAATAPILLATPVGWRAVYFVGVAPLLLIAWARRSLPESRRFEAVQRVHGSELGRDGLRVLRSPWRSRVLWLGLCWALVYACTQNALTFWKDFAVSDRGWTDAEVAVAISVAAVVAMPFVFGVGKVLDGIGRRPATSLIFATTAAGVSGAYLLEGKVALTVCLTLGVFGAAAVLPVLTAFSTELFPTVLRGNAVAWANHGFGRIGHVLSPLAIGLAAEQVGWGPAVAATSLLVLAAAAVVWARLPETAGRELEESARLEPAGRPAREAAAPPGRDPAA